MAAKQFTGTEWEAINAKLEADPKRYGLPQRECGSVLLGSFNIRQMGSSGNRSPDTWEFLAKICRSFDLIAVQEVMDDLSGLRRVMSLLGPEYDLVVSDQTGVFPGEGGVGERLGFIYRWNVVERMERMEVATDITYDRSKVIDSIATDYEAFTGEMDKYAPKYVKHVAKILANQRQLSPNCIYRSSSPSSGSHSASPFGSPVIPIPNPTR